MDRNDHSHPAYSPKNVLRRRDRLWDHVKGWLNSFGSGSNLTEAMASLPDVIASFLSCPRIVVRHYFLGRDRIDDHGLFLHVWRLAGNFLHLRAGIPLGVVGDVLEPDLAPVVILDAKLVGDDLVLVVRFMAGLYVPAFCPVRMPYRWMRVLGRRLGFGGRYQYRHDYDLNGLAFLGAFEPARKRLRLNRVIVPPWAATWNRERLRLRFRDQSCPMGHLPCINCSLTMVSCIGSVHYSERRRVRCVECGRVEDVGAFLHNCGDWADRCMGCIAAAFRFCL